MNFVNYRLFAKILSVNVLFFVDKDRAIALIHESKYYSRNSLSRIFAKIISRENFPLYGMYFQEFIIIMYLRVYYCQYAHTSYYTCSDDYH